MQKKQAYLITAYKDFAAVYELASFLSQWDEVFIHVDKKSKEIGSGELEKLNALPGCHAVSTYSIAWGGYTHIQAILRLMEMAVSREEISYIHLLTGEDFPVVSPKRLHEKFTEDEHIYLSYIEEQDFNEAVRKRYYYYNLFQNRNVKNPILWQFQNLTVGLQKILGIRRKSLGEFRQIYKGLVYMSMPKETAMDILQYVNNHPEYEKALYYCQIPEEFFFHTLLLNEDFCGGKWKPLIVDKELRYMNWERGDGGSPVYLEENDYDEIAVGDYCFARKFHGKESEALKNRIIKNLW
ncbi:MAG: beta-1,6-N-acetylglucosaminyltransferase [Lachnospiraceae bacterium]